MAKSVRYSCASSQKPLSIKIGHLVVTKAVIMIMIRGKAAILVNKPIKINELQIISNVAVKYAQKAGSLNPIFSKRTVPKRSGKKISEYLLKEKSIQLLSLLV